MKTTLTSFAAMALVAVTVLVGACRNAGLDPSLPCDILVATVPLADGTVWNIKTNTKHQRCDILIPSPCPAGPYQWWCER